MEKGIPEGEWQVSPNPKAHLQEQADDSIKLIEILTGGGSMAHLIENHPGQYDDALSMLKRICRGGDYIVSVGVFNEDYENDENDIEYDEERDGGDWEL